jgi:hypothetical protein
MIFEKRELNMRGDSVDNFKGKEDYWAMLCALDSIEYDAPPYPPEGEAVKFVEEVWEFVVGTCEGSDQPVPEMRKVVKLLRERLREISEENG